MTDQRPRFEVSFTEIQWDSTQEPTQELPPTEFTSEWVHASRAQIAVQMAFLRMFSAFNCHGQGVIDCVTVVKNEAGQRFKLDPADRTEDLYGKLIPLT